MSNDPKVKTCNRCKVSKTLDGFYRDATRPSGISTYCKSCTLDARALFRENNREKLKKNARRDRKRFPERGCWHVMISRCCKTSNPAYGHYGGRGISVCSRWLESFDAFLADMGQRPSLRHSIDRIDNSGNYEPGNCRWATPKEQGRNRRNNVLLTIDGRTQCLAAWAEERGVPGRLITDRVRKLGWDPVRAVFEPIQSQGRH